MAYFWRHSLVSSFCFEALLKNIFRACGKVRLSKTATNKTLLYESPRSGENFLKNKNTVSDRQPNGQKYNFSRNFPKSILGKTKVDTFGDQLNRQKMVAIIFLKLHGSEHFGNLGVAVDRSRNSPESCHLSGCDKVARREGSDCSCIWIINNHCVRYTETIGPPSWVSISYESWV